MASPSSNGKDPEGSQPKTENPFIRFRQFADAQISSLLQGIVGLPSAFSNTPPSNARWAEIDDKLHRRDEQQQQLKQSNNSEVAREADKEVEIPVKKFLGRDQTSSSTASSEADSQEMDGMTRDLPLYSPVSPALFAHLFKLFDHTLSRFPATFRYPRSNADTSSPEEVSLNNMKMLQYMTLAGLRFDLSLQSDYSLLPYLLFSAYSPLRLASRPSSTTGQQDDFPYCHAFEDLIRVSQGRPMATTWTRIGFPYDWQFRYPKAYASTCTQWIGEMQRQGLLQQNVPLSSKIKQTDYPSFSQLQQKHANSSTPDVAVSTELRDAQTEQEMYERFLQKAWLPSNIGTVFESLFADIEKEFKTDRSSTGNYPEAEKILRGLQSADKQLSLSSLFSDIEKDLNGLSPREANHALEHIRKDVDDVLATALTPEGRRQLREAWSQTAMSKITTTPGNPEAERPADPDRIVSTSTTTEHIKNEDGSVETSVTVWKRFADGREMMTTSTHSEDPSSQVITQSNEDQQTKKDEQKPEKQGKQGWFWQ